MVAVFLDRIKSARDTANFDRQRFIHTLCSAELLTLIESLMSPVGLPDDDETSACLCMEIRKASTPISPILFPTM